MAKHGDAMIGATMVVSGDAMDEPPEIDCGVPHEGLKVMKI